MASNGFRERSSRIRIDRIAVVVPVNDEERALPRCLHALTIAAARVAMPVAVMVVLDACTDRSAAVTAEFRTQGVEAITVDEHCVGAARAAGMTALLDRLGHTGTWLATTDADSVVPPDWLSAQLRYAKAGAGVVAGTIAVDDWEDRDDSIRDRATTDYRAAPHRHVHGANMSFAASAYRAAGGFRPVTFDEDVALVAAFQANGEPIAWATDLPVVTSARRDARAPRGFASYLTELERSQSEGGSQPHTAVARAV